MSRDELRSTFGMVLQDTWLFHGTIRENIAYGRDDATDEEIEAAAAAAHVDHFVRTLPDGYDTILDDDATSVSQGEKQLLTIARAFLADRRILILDEATSSVDTRTEVLIQRAMAKLMLGRTSFVIAHRLSTIRDAHTILVMDHGHIIEQGTHEALMARAASTSICTTASSPSRSSRRADRRTRTRPGTSPPVRVSSACLQPRGPAPRHGTPTTTFGGHFVRRLLIGLAVAAIGFSVLACSASGGAGGTIEGINWQLKSYDDVRHVHDVPAGVVVDARFAAGKVAGSSGCNTYGGPATINGSTIEIGQLISTMMLCDGPGGDVETAYLAAAPERRDLHGDRRRADPLRQHRQVDPRLCRGVGQPARRRLERHRLQQRQRGRRLARGRHHADRHLRARTARSPARPGATTTAARTPSTAPA